jgi:nicotinamide-nucleotide amidase
MNVARQVVSFLSSRGLKLATAESCTAGQIASCLAEIPGSGACLDVGFVTYSPSGKAGFLGVQHSTMQGESADVAVANTGVADASPSDGPPPGTQCFAWAHRMRDGRIVTLTETRRFTGSRNEIRHHAARYALSRIEQYFNTLGSLR